MAWLALLDVAWAQGGGAVTPFVLRPMHAVVVLWAVALVASIPWRREVGLVALVAAAVQAVAFSPAVIQQAPAATLALAGGLPDAAASSRLGEAFPAFHGLVAWLYGLHPDRVQQAHAVLGVLAAPALAFVVGALRDDRTEALVAGLLAATAPLLLAVGASEHPVALATSWTVLGAAGAVRHDLPGDVLAATSLGLAAHAHPVAVPVALVWLLWLGTRGRAGVLILGGLLVGWRVGELVAWGVLGSLAWEPLQHLEVLTTEAPVGARGWSVVADPFRTPVVVSLAAGVGVGIAVREARAVRGGRPWALADALPASATLLLPLSALAAWLGSLDAAVDALRVPLRSAVQPWWCALAALALVALGRRGAGWGVAGAVGVVLSLAVARAPLSPPWAWTAAHPVLKQAVAAVPEGQVVQVASGLPDLARWASAHSAGTWTPEPTPGAWRWFDVHDADALPADARTREAVVEAELPARWGGWRRDGGVPVWVGLVR